MEPDADEPAIVDHDALCERGPHVLTRSQQLRYQTHRLHSPKAGHRAVLSGSQRHADAVVMFEGDPAVITLCERPLRIHGSIGTLSHVTLDLGVTDRRGAERFYMVCSEWELEENASGQLLPKHWPAIERLAERSGHKCAVLTESEIDAHRVRVHNWRLLLPFVRAFHERPSLRTVDDIVALFDDRVDYSLEELHVAVASTVAVHLVPAVAHLLHIGRYDARLDQSRFTRRTPIRRRDDA